MNIFILVGGLAYYAYCVTFFVANVALGLYLILDVIALLQGFIGGLAYVAWIVVAPIISPVMIIFPWFDAWVQGGEIDPVILLFWIAWCSCLILTPLAKLLKTKLDGI